MQLNSLRNELSTLQNKHQEDDKRVQEMAQEVQLLKDQNALLKAQKGDGISAVQRVSRVADISSLFLEPRIPGQTTVCPFLQG